MIIEDRKLKAFDIQGSIPDLLILDRIMDAIGGSKLMEMVEEKGRFEIRAWRKDRAISGPYTVKELK